ncbi:hypothetical protein QH494_19285 [Sphingomonas sp. AR_OL41]|jgi:hypothetical protein|uniref:hypothetical protein n=1 Tax=Sphingomonas sp. AR_OL41 TaxID=3042729 RepID=UPI00247FF0FC|nr:hypothetical protein [Sphingomonas sp. AR_OL41]MDH7974338.1 hypothetical protein [Sphingomonas sp. AR_OL41]
MDERNRWIMLIKELRTERQIGIFEAERLALARPEWRRWVEQQINTDQRCQRMAHCHIRHNGDAALLEKRGGRYVVR